MCELAGRTLENGFGFGRVEPVLEAGLGTGAEEALEPQQVRVPGGASAPHA
jgi:hypothetical protein